MDQLHCRGRLAVLGRMHASSWIYGLVLQHSRGASYRWRLAWKPRSLHCVPCNASGTPPGTPATLLCPPRMAVCQALASSAGERQLYKIRQESKVCELLAGQESHRVWIYFVNCQTDIDPFILGVQA